MMQGQEITFLGGINTDDDVRFITEGDYRSSKYARTGSAEDQNMGALESMPGNILIDNPDYPEGVNTVVGSAKWIENNSIIYFVFNDQGYHSIWTYKLDTKEIKKVISNLTITIPLPPPLDPITAETYAGEALNFQVKNKIYHANVIDNILYWTDGYNPPRKLDINSAITFIESNGLSEEGYNAASFVSVEEASKTMDVLKAPPTVIIEAEYQTNPDKNFNKLYGNQYQFRYQYVYENNEESKWSMISKQPFPTVSEFVAGRNTIDALADNEIKLTYNTGSVNVRQINFAYRRGENGPWLVFKQLDKRQEDIIIPPYSENELIFDDNTAPIGASLTDILYDNVPQIAQCQEILSNQSLAYANFYADYDLVENINVTTERNLTELYEASNNTIFALIGNSYSGLDEESEDYCRFEVTVYEANFWYYEEGDVLVFTLKAEDNDYKKYYYRITSEEAQYPLDYPNNYHARYKNLFSNIKTYFESEFNLNMSYFSSLSTCYFQFNGLIGSKDTEENSVSNPQGDYIFWQTKCNITRSNKCQKSLKKGSKKVFGIQYYDRGNRSNTVQTTPGMILEVPFPGQEDLSSFQYNIDEFGRSQSAYTVNPKFTINHLPPDWATHYSILVKKDELISSFMQTTITYVAQGSSINTLVFQLDKVPVQTSVDFYTAKYQGATFYHTPSRGDRVRFISGEYLKNPLPESEGEDASQIISSSYITNYKEVEVLSYDASTNQIIVNEFDYISLFGGSMLGFGALCEIYTPKKDVAEDIWYEIEKFDIIDDNGFRYHGGNTQNQTVDQAAIIESNYGDIYYRKRELATGVDFAIFANYSDVVLDSLTKRKWTITWNNDPSPEERGTYTFTTWFNRFFGGSATYTATTGYFNRFLGLTNVYNDQYIFLPTMISRFYFIEDFNYSDYYVSDGHGRGRIGIENNKTVRTHYKTGVIHSAQYVMGSFINGLSSFDTLGNAEYLDDTFGPVNRLKQVGYTLKALQDRKEVSIYIQRSYATSGDGTGQLAYASKTFGGVNPSETLYGCIHPGSVLIIENNMYYYDYYSGTVVRSSSNGQYDLSGLKYKFNYWITNKTTQIGTVEQKDVFGELYQSKYEPIAFVDETNSEYTLNFVKYFYPVDKPAQVLGNKIYYQYDSNDAPIFDYMEDRWKTFVDYDLYWAETLGANVFTFKRDDLYEHNVAFLEDGTANELNFYGEQKTMSVEFVLNQDAIVIKRPLSIGLRSNKLFDLTKVSTKGNASYPVMESKLYPNNFKLKEGYWWSAYLRDMTNIIASKPSQNTADKALINGRELRGYAIIHNIEYTGNEKAILFDVKCSYVPSEAMI